MRAVLPLTGRFMFARGHAGDSGAFVLSAAGKERLRVRCWLGMASATNSEQCFMLYCDVLYVCHADWLNL